MKKIFLMCLTILLMSCLSTVQKPVYAFEDKPAAFIVFDNSGNVDENVYRIWREPVRWAYHFPYYKLIDTDRPKMIAAEELFSRESTVKIDAVKMQDIAKKIPATAIVLVIVHDLDQRIVQGGFFREHGETYVATTVVADIYIYNQDSDKFLGKRIRERDIEPLGNQKDPIDLMKWAISKYVNTVEDRPIIN